MSVIFSSDFSNLNVWDYHFGVGTPSLGCDRGPCLSCGQVGAFGVWKTLGSFTAGSARMMFAAIAQTTSPEYSFDPFLHLWTPVNDKLFEIRTDVLGKITIHAIGGETANSPVGLIPVDGTFHTLQVTWNLYLAPHPTNPALTNVNANLQFILDNSVIFTKLGFIVSAYDYGTSSRDYHWARIGFAANLVQPIPHFMNIAIDNVEIEDVAIVKAMTPCPTGQLSNIACALLPPVVIPPADKSGIYMITTSNKTHDIYNEGELKIPNPTFKTGILGE